MLGDVGVVEDVGEDILAAAGFGDSRFVEPEAVGVAAVEGDHAIVRNPDVVPAGVGIERHVETEADRQLFQGQKVFGVAGFVVQLDADDGAAVFVEKAVELLANLGVIVAGEAHKRGIIPADDFALFQHPIGQPAIADFAVAPRADAGIDVQAVLGAELDELAKVSIAGPIELAFDFLVIDPDNVGGDDGDSPGFHLEYFIFPLLMGNTDVMELAHDRNPGIGVFGEVSAVDADLDALGIFPAHLEVAGGWSNDGTGNIGEESACGESGRGGSGVICAAAGCDEQKARRRKVP